MCESLGRHAIVGKSDTQIGVIMTELEILEAEYQRLLNDPLFDAPEMYTVILDLVADKIDEIYDNLNR